MKTLRIYIENSVIGGYFDKEFKDPTRKLFELIRQGVYRAVISAHAVAELDNGAPHEVKDNLQTIKYERHEVSEEMLALSQKYMAENIVTKKYYGDALHIAIATVLGVDVLVSWNFKHIANLNKIKLFNSVNLREGYGILDIRTPLEVTEND
ncbi:putative PIN domain protein [Candidatus Termititenax aidoneus]|uniref:PIN domain protein n=1 Tax=Termititenax aidoneus TaxID=2218524 RepID=A0A388TB68_TERA1|nr:putative PIN domain protein [Candidatus Termititenax aidoneus]